MDGAKDVENRSWPTRYRGWLLIHAGKTYDDSAREFCFSQGYARAHRRDCLHGDIIGAVHLVECARLEDLSRHNPWAFGPWCWRFNDAVCFPEGAHTIRGKQGLWTPPYDNQWWLDYIDHRLYPEKYQPPTPPEPAHLPRPALLQPELPGLA